VKKSFGARVEWRVERVLGNEPLLALREEYLKPVGWARSRAQAEPVDAAGNPLPWITYAAIDFLADRVQNYMRVFEFGSGNSTRWWARRTNCVVACEHDETWFRRVQATMPVNVTLLHHELVPGGEYCRSVLSAPGPFHVVVIDGRDRNNCARNAVSALRSDGVVLWDNSERPEYDTGIAELLASGFRRIDFTGMGPINAHQWRTTLFYKPENCLGI
jgi:hypothetical protein